MTAPVDTLVFWHPNRSEPLNENYFQWGIVVPNSSADMPFRLRNLSAVYTARSITIGITELGSPTRSVAAQHYLSRNGVVFVATLPVGDLAPKGITEVLTLRRVVAADADEGDGDFQLQATATDWV